MSFTSNFNRFTAHLREFILAWRQGAPPIEYGATAEVNLSASREEEFNALAQELFGLQLSHNAPYRRFCEARGLFSQDVKNWAEIPAMPTVAFKEFELSCIPPHERTSVFHSSGTTEHRPSRHFHNEVSLAIYEESLWAWFLEKQKAATFPQYKPADRLLILTPPPAQAPHSSLVHMFETIRLKLGAVPSVYAAHVDNTAAWVLDFELAIRLMREAQAEKHPVLLLGTAFSYVHLLDSFAERGLRPELPAGSQAMETGGYKGRSRELPKPKLYALISQRLGIPQNQIVCEYGMSELSSQAYGFEITDTRSMSGKNFQFPPWARVQIISPESGREVAEGETGLIRVFDLANVFSVMAVQTEDLGVRRGNGFELIGRAALAEARGCSVMPA